MTSAPFEWRKYFRDAPNEPGDEQEGTWPRTRLISMDRRFVERVEHAFKNGGESVAAAGATVSLAHGWRQQENAMQRDYLRNSKRWGDPVEAVTEIVNAHPNDRERQRRVFEAMVLGSGSLMTAVIARVFDALTTPPAK